MVGIVSELANSLKAIGDISESFEKTINKIAKRYCFSHCITLYFSVLDIINMAFFTTSFLFHIRFKIVSTSCVCNRLVL